MSGRLNRYFNQRATFGRQTGVDSFGQPERATSMIDCRIQKILSMTKDSTGREVTSTITVYIEPQDDITSCEDLMGTTINGMPVLTVSEMVDGRGNVVGFEVLL